jgi:hypothetical protein
MKVIVARTSAFEVRGCSGEKLRFLRTKGKSKIKNQKQKLEASVAKFQVLTSIEQTRRPHF